MQSTHSLILLTVVGLTGDMQDLVSNLIGFYRVVKGYSESDIDTWCKVIRDIGLTTLVSSSHLRYSTSTFAGLSCVAPKTRFSFISTRYRRL